MYSQRLTQFLKKLLAVFITALTKMWSWDTKPNHITKNGYFFRPFNFERIKPSQSSVVPFSRSGHRVAADSSNFYSFGGYNPLFVNDAYVNEGYVDSYPLFREMWKYNFATKTWTKFTNSETLPKELASNAVLLYKNFLMVYGGTGSPFGARCSNQLHICRISNESNPMVEVKASGQLPIAQYGQAVIFHNDYLYTIGGTTGLSYTCDIHRLCLKTLRWEAVYICKGQGDYEPEGRYRHEVAFDGRKIYILGGGTAVEAYDFEHIPTFDVELKKWSRERSLKCGRHGYPSPRRCHGVVQIEQPHGIQAFITGGHDGENIFNDLWRLDLVTLQWTYFEFCHLPYRIYFHAACVTPAGRLYVFGGICNIFSDIKRSNSVYSTWLCIPKLSELCWEAVLHYSPHIVDCDSDDLINLGLPRQFVRRLGNRLHSDSEKMVVC